MKEKTIEELKLALFNSESEITFLKNKYNSDIVEFQKETEYLKEQLMAQQCMLNDAIGYATKLEKQFNQLKDQIKKGKFESIH